jgi:biotin--protein ligase
VLSRLQTRGQGNNKNEWLSPFGCCMFTLYLNLNTDNFPASRLCLLQFAAALSCSQAILKTPGCEVNPSFFLDVYKTRAFKYVHNIIKQELPIQIKWPNDIYFDGVAKLGGVLVKSSVMGNLVNVKIGVGFNIDNEHPTECLNKVLRDRGLSAAWTCEMFVARFMNSFEQLLTLLATSNSFSVAEFCSLFQNDWLHK